MTGYTMEASGEHAPDDLLEEAKALLAAPDLLERAEDLVARLGLCGERVNGRFIFLAGVGGHLGEPIHCVIHGESSGGKNTLAGLPLRLLPPERVLEVSGLSEQALSYHDGPVEGVLLIAEAEGFKHAEYSIRTAMSEGRVSRMTVTKTGHGQLKGETPEVEVTASIITTTTAPSLHAENQTRVFDLWIDESEEQTRRILLAKAEESTSPDAISKSEDELQVWHIALRLLSPAPVAIPFATEIAKRFPTRPVRARRDFPRCLSLIRASALLHQKQRKQNNAGEIVATVQDYELVYPVIQAVLAPSMSGLTEKALLIADIHQELASRSEGEWIQRADLQREAHSQGVATANTVHKWCKEFTALGIWEGRKERGRWMHRSLRDPRLEPVSIPTPEELSRVANLPATSQDATGRPNTFANIQLQKLRSETDSNQRDRRSAISISPVLSDDSEGKLNVSRYDIGNNVSQQAGWESAGGCTWCGQVSGVCGFCTPADFGGCQR